MKIIITGALGFIGSNLAHWIIENTKDEIMGIDNLSGGFIENMPVAERFHFAQIDILNSAGINGAFEYFKPDVCFHLAAYAAESRSNAIRVFNHTNNTVGTATIINACVNYKVKLIFTSSVAVYSGTPPFNENTIPNPIDEYGLSKWCSEKSIEIAHEQQGLDYCIIRPRNVYGQRQSLWDSQRNVFGIWMNQILNDKPMTIFDNGNNKRAFTYIEDILPCLYRAKDLRNEIVNLGSPTVYSIMQACMVLQQVTGFKKVDFLPARHEVEQAYCTTLRQKEFLGYNNETTLYDGLKQMWRWAQRQPRREMIKPPELEIKL